MADGEDVCVLIPTLNEAETIGQVIEGLQDAGYSNILVIDGDSTDGTREIAEDAGAEVVMQTGSGKGQAVMQGIDRIESPYILMLDGDGTYDPAQADRLVEPLKAGDADHVIGNRFADMRSGAMTRFNRFGNWLFNSTFSHIHGDDFEDILSGYRAFTLESAERMFLSSRGFGIETEMAVECVKHDLRVEVVPITYKARPSGSSPNLHPIKDGGRILFTLYSLAKTTNPMFYFGSVGGVVTGLGVLLGGYVGYEWFFRDIPHEIIAILATLCFLFGGQLIIFGFLSDLVVTLHEQEMKRIEKLEDSEK